jgi:hypothetical protein
MDADAKDRKISTTIGKIVRNVKDEVTDLLTETPEYTGSMTVKMNFRNGFCPNINCSKDKSILL